MIDLRPVGYVIGLLVAVLGLTMLLPLLVDLAEGRGHWPVFLESSVITMLCGGLIALACANGVREGLTIQQTFLLTTGVWLTLPLFGAIPFVFGATEARFVDAFFEAMSGLTTTGSTVFSGLEELPKGLLLWRGIMQWLGGIGIIVVAMVFLPELRVGGMQIFRSEGFDTFGKILPRATEISSRISVIYIGLTLACAIAYISTGMNAFDATVHAMTTIATGGFANYDASFANFSGATEYAAVAFMLLAALPFVRFVQLTAGSAKPLFHDSQIRAFFGTAVVAGFDHRVLENVSGRRSGRGNVPQDPVQYRVFADGHRLCQRGLHDLGRIADCGSVFHRPDRWLRGVNGLFYQDFPLPVAVCVDPGAALQDQVAPRRVYPAL